MGVEHRSPVDACTGEKLPEQIYARETTETQAKEERPGHQQQVDFTNQETAERLVGFEKQGRAEEKGRQIHAAYGVVEPRAVGYVAVK